MNKQDRLNVLRDNIVDCEVWQKKPYTAARVIVRLDGKLYTDVGFCKVKYPDEWDEKYGVDLATNKALAGVDRQVNENKHDSRTTV